MPHGNGKVARIEQYYGVIWLASPNFNRLLSRWAIHPIFVEYVDWARSLDKLSSEWDMPIEWVVQNNTYRLLDINRVMQLQGPLSQML